MAEQEELKKIDITAQLGNFLKTVKRFWLLMVIGTILMMGIYFVYTWINYSPMYQSQATFTVNGENSSIVSSGVSGSEQIKESLPYILNSQYMRNLVMEDLEINYFPASVQMESKELAEFYVLKVTSGDPEAANKVMDSIIANCPRASVYVLGKISLDVLDTVSASSTPINHMDKQTSLVKGGVLGVFLSVAIAFFYTLTNRTIRKEEELKHYLSVSCLAMLPQIVFKKRRKKIDTHIHIHNDKVGHVFLENIRTMRARVQRAMEKMEAKTILVTSSIPSEGKSTVAANLALSLAEKGGKVVLVDLDLRNPSVKEVLGAEIESNQGVVDILNGKQKLEKQLYFVKAWNLSVLFAGASQNNPLGLMNKETLSDMILELKERYDYVVLDTPPAAMLSDASAIAKHADCALYVVKQDFARIERIAEGMEALNLAQVPIIGVVLNGMERVLGSYGYGHYRYGSYGDYREQEGNMPEYVSVSNPWESK